MRIRKWQKWTLTLFTLAILVFLSIVVSQLWKWSDYLVNRPPPYPLHTQNQRLLDHPEQYGITYQILPCGQTECLLLTPKGNRAIDSRTIAIREQLPQYGVTPPPYGNIHAILVMLHGLGGRKEHYLTAALPYLAAGYAVILPDLPNHGKNPINQNGFGKAKNEADIPSIAAQTARTALHHPTLPAALLGISMGGSYANYAVQAHPNDFKALIIISSFNRLNDVLLNQLNTAPAWSRTPLLWAYRHIVTFRGGTDPAHINPIDAAKNIPIPVFQVHGAKDPLIPIALAETLNYAYPKATFLTVPDANHNNTLRKKTPVFAPSIAYLESQLKP